MYDVVLEHITTCKKALSQSVCLATSDFLKEWEYKTTLENAEMALHDLRRAEEAYRKGA